MTSLNAPGFSISLLNLSSACRRLGTMNGSSSPSRLLEFLDAPTDATAWPGVRNEQLSIYERCDSSKEDELSTELLASSQLGIPDQENRSTDSSVTWRSLDVRPERVESGIRVACKSALSVEPDLTQFDTLVGDGDCGETFSSGAKGRLLSSALICTKADTCL